MNIRTLKANEIECRIGSLKNNGLSLLLYKDARADMKILDEIFGFDGWERSHEVIDGKLFCTVRVWSEKRNCWISKQDVGTESNAEKEKGQVSDSFKRACVNLGIGRELYTAPFIWINGNFDKYVKFDVKEIAYNEDREIKDLVIVDSEGNIVYKFKNGEQVKTKKRRHSNLYSVQSCVILRIVSQEFFSRWRWSKMCLRESYLRTVNMRTTRSSLNKSAVMP